MRPQRSSPTIDYRHATCRRSSTLTRVLTRIVGFDCLLSDYSGAEPSTIYEAAVETYLRAHRFVTKEPAAAR